MFIAITPYQVSTKEDLNHYIEISEHIDLLLLRTPMNHQNLFATIDYLITHGFPKNKIMLHTHTSLVATFDLKYVHFKENDAKAFLFKKQHPDISVSMSTHNIETVTKAEKNNLDFVFFGHVFESSSKQGAKPRSLEEIKNVLSIDIPIFAIGGIDEHTIQKLPIGFQGVCAISFFRNAGNSAIKSLRKEWESYV